MMKRSLLLGAIVLGLIASAVWYVKMGKDQIEYMKKTMATEYKEPLLEAQLKLLNAKLGDRVFIRIFKEEQRLEMWVKVEGEFKLLKAYPICAYSGELGPKLKEGDGQAPEGFYRVYKSSLNPNSRFHLSFNLGFPNEYDRSHGRTGSYLMVHGNCVSIGCYAMTDAKIEEIYGLVEAALKEGQGYVPVHIFPFEMSDEKLAAFTEHEWYDFWSNLQEGYDYFELEKRPPLVRAVNQRYEILDTIE